MVSALIERVKTVLGNDQIEAYARDGVVCIRKLFNSNEIETLKTGIDHNLKNPSPRAKIASHAQDPGLFIEDFCNWNENLHYKDFIFNSPVGVAAGYLMKSRMTRLYHDHMLVKESNTHQQTPWHQDQPYYNIDGRQNCSFWIPVDPIPYGSSLKFIAGSHLGPWLMPRSFMDHQAKWFPEGTLAELPDIQSRPQDFPILGWELNPGDAVCFHMLTLHASSGSQNRRRVFSVRFLGDDIVHAPRTWKTSPEFPGLSDQLAPGLPMAHPLFPLLFDDKKHK